MCSPCQKNKKAMKSFDSQLPRLTFLCVGTRGLSKAALWLCLRRYAPPPCSSPFHRADKKKNQNTNVLWFFLVRWKGLEPPAY